MHVLQRVHRWLRPGARSSTRTFKQRATLWPEWSAKDYSPASARSGSRSCTTSSASVHGLHIGPSAGPKQVDPVLLVRAREMLANTSGKLLIREQMHATGYRQRRDRERR